MKSLFHAMRALAAFVLLLGLVLPARAYEPLLVRLSDAQGAGTVGKIEIRDKTGAQAVATAHRAARWLIQPGATIKSGAAPRDRVIELYSGATANQELLARVWIRYYPTASGWVPHYQLHQEPTVVRVNGEWQPLAVPAGPSGLVVQHGSTLPNADGFFRQIEFSLSAGPVAITAWQIVR